MTETIQEEAVAADAAFYAAFAAKDIAAMERLWAAGTSVTCIHPGWNVLTGRDEVLASWRGILANPAQARVVGGATATVRGEVAIVVCRELAGGMPLVATNVFVRGDGVWRLLHHQAGAVLAPG